MDNTQRGRNRGAHCAGSDRARIDSVARSVSGYPAAATARRASTPTRCARYSAPP